MTKTQKVSTILLVVVLLGASLYLAQKNQLASTTPTEDLPTVITNTQNTNTVIPEYGLFAQTESNRLNNYTPATHYKNAGDIATGAYKGYHRVIGFLVEDGPGGPTGFTFATKDYKTFILDSGTYPYGSNASAIDDLNSPASLFNKEKVTSVAELPTDFPAIIDQGNFIFTRGSLTDSMAPTGEYNLLKSSVPGLKVYFFGTNVAEAGVDQDIIIGEATVTATTDIEVTDASGVLYHYTFSTKEMYARKQKLAKNEYTPEAYQDLYIQSDFQLNEPHYSAYGQFLPGGCGAMGSTYVLQNVTDGDFVAIGKTLAGVTLYKPADLYSPMNKAEYHRKVDVYKDYQYYLEMNKITTVPSYESYVAKNPVLAFKDAWGRWIGLGEVEYELPGGCGKPVVYLYPETPTDVSLSFATPVIPDRAIPAYANGWNVSAYPDGTLKDLQPEKTDCSAISYTMPGAEYARDTCPKGIYPYLYWSGDASGTYPKQTNGWIIEQKNVAQFLDAKLTEIGLSEKEKQDMTSYWVPALLAKNAPLYRIAFIQTKEMNAFIPMKVSPAPDTTLRIFLDWQPLSEKPVTPLVPQVLEHLTRRGFTLVEWGGLRLP